MLRVVPSGAASSSYSEDAAHAAAGEGTVYGVHDSMRNGLRTIRNEIIMGHPLESHLNQWEQTQDELKLNMARLQFGTHLPIRIQMERELVSQRKRLPVFKQSNIAQDILSGKDQTIEFEDFLGDVTEHVHRVDVHAAMETSLGMTRTGAGL